MYAPLELTPLTLTGLPQLQERRGILQAELHKQCDGNERDAEKERQAPTPVHECLLRGIGSHQKEGKIGENDTGRCTDLREATVKPTLGRRRAFCGDQHRAAPLTADRYALHEPQHDP